TDPVAGTSVERGQEIAVYVSTGQEMATVPTLVGATLAEATTALDGAGLKLGAVTSVNDPDLAADTVISAQYEAGEEVPLGTVVRLDVASGEVTVIDFRDFSVAEAESQITARKLTV